MSAPPSRHRRRGGRGKAAKYPYDHRIKGKQTRAAVTKMIECAKAIMARTVIRCPVCDGDVATLALDHYSLEYQTNCVGVCGLVGPKGATSDIAETKFKQLMFLQTVRTPRKIRAIPAPPESRGAGR